MDSDDLCGHVREATGIITITRLGVWVWAVRRDDGHRQSPATAGSGDSLGQFASLCMLLMITTAFVVVSRCEGDVECHGRVRFPRGHVSHDRVDVLLRGVVIFSGGESRDDLADG